MIEISGQLKNMIEENALSLATIDESGNPHCIAVGFVKVVSKSQILVTDNYMAETRRNIHRTASIALAVWNKDWKESSVGYELRGSAEYFASGKWYEMAKRIPENEGEPCKGAILITINRIKRLA